MKSVVTEAIEKQQIIAANAAFDAMKNRDSFLLGEGINALVAEYYLTLGKSLAYDQMLREATEIDAVVGAQTALERENSALNLENRELQAEARQARIDCNHYREQVSILHSAVWDATQNEKAMAERLVEVEAMNESLKNENGTLLGLLALTERTLNEAKNQAVEQAEKANARFDSKKAECNQLRHECQSLRETIDDLRQDLDDCEKDEKAVREQNTEYREENRKIGDDWRNQESEIQALKAEIGGLRATIDDMTVQPVNVHPDQLPLPLASEGNL